MILLRLTEFHGLLVLPVVPRGGCPPPYDLDRKWIVETDSKGREISTWAWQHKWCMCHRMRELYISNLLFLNPFFLSIAEIFIRQGQVFKFCAREGMKLGTGRQYLPLVKERDLCVHFLRLLIRSPRPSSSCTSDLCWYYPNSWFSRLNETTNQPEMRLG